MKISRLAALLAALFAVSPAWAATPAVTLTASPSSGASPVATILSWSTVPAALSCMASGGWSGNHSPSGSASILVTASTTYTLTCTWAGAATTAPVTVTWTPPTENTNGTALTNLASYNVYLDTVNPPGKVIANVLSPATTFVIASPPAGTDYIAVTALNSQAGASSLSNIVTLTVASVAGTAVTETASATVTVAAALPAAPTAVTASQ